MGRQLVRQRLQPDTLFARVTEMVPTFQLREPELEQWLLWDYTHYSLLSRKTPDWIAQRLQSGPRISLQATRRRLPVVTLSAASAELVNRLTGAERKPGSYAIWPQQHKKGKPVQIYPLESVEEGRICDR